MCALSPCARKRTKRRTMSNRSSSSKSGSSTRRSSSTSGSSSCSTGAGGSIRSRLLWDLRCLIESGSCTWQASTHWRSRSALCTLCSQHSCAQHMSRSPRAQAPAKVTPCTEQSLAPYAA